MTRFAPARAGLPERLVARTADLLAGRVSRRSFLTRSAMVGAALVAAPVRFALRPGTAYAAICSCDGSRCDCSSLCCDGWTEFCCTITGENACPPDTLAAGWWKADGSGFCVEGGVDKPRYYLDCNKVPGSTCRCECANGDCRNRGTCCTNFRYGQCNQHVAGLGTLVCRVVSCTPPWEIDSSCTMATATDNATRRHHAACLEASPPPGDPAEPGLPVGVPIVGDWADEGRDRVGVVRLARWHLEGVTRRDRPGLPYGDLGDIPVAGDWDGDGVATPGVVRDGVWYLRNSNTPGPADIVFPFGNPGDTPVVGDWDGDGVDTPGVVRNGIWFLRNRNRPGRADIVFAYGDPGDTPVVGDWDGDGVDTPGVVRNGIWYLRNANRAGAADITFAYGNPGDTPVAGDWDGDGVDGPGVVRAGVWYLRNKLSTGAADEIVR